MEIMLPSTHFVIFVSGKSSLTKLRKMNNTPWFTFIVGLRTIPMFCRFILFDEY